MISALFYLYCYVKIGLSSPGLACSDIEPTLDLKITERYCVPCRVVREPGTKHCYYCDVCIYKYDHHCPWVGKCIGRDNICMFYVFLTSVTVLMGCLVIAAVSATKMVIWMEVILLIDHISINYHSQELSDDEKSDLLDGVSAELPKYFPLYHMPSAIILPS